MDSDDESEDAYDLREVSSDVEMDPNDIDSDARYAHKSTYFTFFNIHYIHSRFEEMEDEHPKNLKRARDADAEKAAPVSKAEKKKKQKGEDGKPVAVPEEKKEKKEKAEAAPAKASKAVEKEIAGGIKILDSKIGTGPMAKKGNTVRMRYIGKLQSGKIFDQNVKGKPVSSIYT
jgi:FK506-binding nuclear protein